MVLSKGLATLIAAALVIAGVFVESPIASWILLSLSIGFAAFSAVAPVIEQWRLNRAPRPPRLEENRVLKPVRPSSWWRRPTFD